MQGLGNHGLIQYNPFGQRSVDKAVIRDNFIHNLLHRRVTRLAPLLHKLNAWHGTQFIRPQGITSFGTTRLVQPIDLFPPYLPIRLVQRELTEILIAFDQIFRISKVPQTYISKPRKNIEAKKLILYYSIKRRLGVTFQQLFGSGDTYP